MKVYFGIKYHPDNRNRETIEKVSDVLARCDLKLLCITRDVERWGAVRLAPEELMEKTFETIDGCAVVVIELSEKGVGLGIEAGYAYAKGIPVVTIAKRGAEISETLWGISKEVFFYDEYGDLEPLFINFKEASPQMSRSQTPIVA